MMSPEELQEIGRRHPMLSDVSSLLDVIAEMRLRLAECHTLLDAVARSNVPWAKAAAELLSFFGPQALQAANNYLRMVPCKRCRAAQRAAARRGMAAAGGKRSGAMCMMSPEELEEIRRRHPMLSDVSSLLDVIAEMRLRLAECQTLLDAVARSNVPWAKAAAELLEAQGVAGWK
jgi:hypothetical protein